MSETPMTEAPTEIVLRHSGEMVDPQDPSACLRALGEVEEFLARAAEAKRALAHALSVYSIDRGERTVVLPDGSRFVREGGPKKEYPDPTAVEKDLLAAGCPPERVKEIVVTKMTVEKRVNGTEAAKAGRNNPAYAEVLDRHRRTVEKPYTIRRD